MAPDFNWPKLSHIAGPDRVVARPPAPTDKSIIGSDLKISGQGLKIISDAVLQVDGEIQGDVEADEVVIGERGQVIGMVAGQYVTVRGAVSGAICAKTVVLEASARVDGDIHHMSLAMVQGALFEGRSRRAASEDDLEAGAPRKERAEVGGLTASPP